MSQFCDVTHAFKLFGTWDLPFFRGRTDALGSIAGGSAES
jgi:hypothetical protein